MNNNETALQGTRLPKIGSNGAVLLSPEYRDRIVNLLNALANLEVIIPQTDGSNVQDAKKARIDISELAMRIILPPLNIPSPSGGGTSNFVWQTPYKELDPTVAVAQYTFVTISPNNPLASSGMLDLVSATNITSRPGIWQALVAVPAQVVNPPGPPAGIYYNVPQLPYLSNGSFSGHPYTGMMDGTGGTLTYWAFWGELPTC